MVRPYSSQAQPLCFAAYRPARAVQPFDNFRHRIFWPQSRKFKKFIVGPTGHFGLINLAPRRGLQAQVATHRQILAQPRWTDIDP